MAAPPQISALAKILAAQRKAQESRAIETIKSQGLIAGAQQDAQLELLAARAEAAAQGPAESVPADVSDIFPTAPGLDPSAPGNALQRSLAQGLSPAAATSGGRAVQQAAGLTRGVPETTTTTTRRQAEVPIQQRGAVTMVPTQETVETTRPNVLSPFQAGQLEQGQQRLAIEQQRSEAQQRERVANTTLDLIKEGLPPSQAAAAAAAIQSGDPRQIEAVTAGDKTLSQKVKEQQIKTDELRAEESRARIDQIVADTELTPARRRLLEAQIGASEAQTFQREARARALGQFQQQTPLDEIAGMALPEAGVVATAEGTLRRQEPINITQLSDLIDQAFRKDANGIFIDVRNRANLELAQSGFLRLTGDALFSNEVKAFFQFNAEFNPTRVPANDVADAIAVIEGEITLSEERQAQAVAAARAILIPLNVFIVGTDKVGIKPEHADRRLALGVRRIMQERLKVREVAQ